MIIDKLWGYENIIVNTDLYCGKIIHVNAGKRGSFHYHKIKDETFYLLKGKVEINYSLTDEFYTDTIILNEGDKFYLPPGLRHQIVGIEDSDIIEFSTKDMDEDSYRVIHSEDFL
jgi:mannose-6-phosphate isomerase-like protein (cupin superfamily)